MISTIKSGGLLSLNILMIGITCCASSMKFTLMGTTTSLIHDTLQCKISLLRLRLWKKTHPLNKQSFYFTDFTLSLTHWLFISQSFGHFLVLCHKSNTWLTKLFFAVKMAKNLPSFFFARLMIFKRQKLCWPKSRNFDLPSIKLLVR